MNTELIEHRLIKVSVAIWVSTIVTLIVQLISVPICLHFWGHNTYGIWLSVLAAFTLMRSVDYGYTLYVGNEINVRYHISNRAMLLNLSSSLWGILVIGLLQLLFLVIMYISNNMHFVTGLKNSNNPEIFWALFIMSVTWICSAAYIGIVHRILNPLGMLLQSTWMMMWLQVVQFIVIIIAAFLNMSIINTAILYSLAQVVFYYASAIYIKIILPEYFPWWKNSSFKFGVKNIINAFPQTIGWVMMQGGVSGLVLLVAAFFGPAVVPVFTTLRTISNLWSTLINSFSQPLIPEAVRFYTTRKPQKLMAVNQVHGILMSAVVNLSILAIYPFIEEIFVIWTGHHLQFNKILLNLLLASISILGVGSLMGTFLAGINHVSYIIISSALRGVLVLALGWFFLHKYGLSGIGLAILISEFLTLIVIGFWYFVLVAQKFNSSIRLADIWQPCISSLCVIIFLLADCYSLSYINWLYLGSVSIVIACSIYMWWDFDIEIKLRLIFSVKKHILRK